MDTNHLRFKEHLKKSKSCVFLAAAIMNEKGYDVIIPATQIAPEHKDWEKYKDNGDIFIRLKNTNYAFRRIEVKGLSCDFTDASNWPFGSSAIVCAKHAYDNAIDKPMAIMFFNKDRTSYGVIKNETMSDWYIERRQDSRYESYSQEFYLCPIALVKFEPVMIGG